MSAIDTAAVPDSDERGRDDEAAQPSPEETGLADGGVEMRTIPLALLVPHPDNPRSDLGDLTELERSIKANGVLVPLLVLPKNDDGVHLIVAGHRRHAASQRAKVSDAPVMVRPMTRVEAIEAMVSENVNRDALSVADEIRAIKQLMSLDGALTPAKLCRRIGKSQAWVRTRMAVTILPTEWREAIDAGELSLAAAEAAASAADLGPEHMDAVCARLARHRWGDPAREVEQYRQQLQREAAYAKALDNAMKTGVSLFTDDESIPKKAKGLNDLFSADLRSEHHGEPCHALVLKPSSWGDGIQRYEVCTQPSRHSAKSVESGKGSALAADQKRRVDTESTHQKRKGRIARLDHAVAVFAKARGGPSQAELVRLALTALVHEAGRVALGNAATMLGRENPRDVLPEELLAGADTPSTLARVAAAVACGLAEDDMYWASSSAQCGAWIDLLCRSGWTPDEWTATVLEHRRQRLATEPYGSKPDDDEDTVDLDDRGDRDELGDLTEEVRDELGEEADGGLDADGLAASEPQDQEALAGEPG